MKTLKFFLLLFSTAFLSITSCTNDDETVTIESFDRNKMDQLFLALEEDNLVMGTISIFKGKKEVYHNSIGMADLEKSIPIEPETKFRIGSISKTITAIMIMQLIDENKLTMQTPLSDYYPDIPNASLITISDLLRHRSGLFNYPEAEDFVSWYSVPQTKEELLEKIINNGTISDPNIEFRYSNTNYVLLSFIIEDLDGVSFSKALANRIRTPLGLKNTYMGSDVNLSKDIALPYDFTNNEWVQLPPRLDSHSLGDGGAISTVRDLNLIFNALFNGLLVSESALNEMTTVIDISGAGLFPLNAPGHPAFEHAGAIDTYFAQSTYFINEDISISFASNATNFFDPKFADYNLPEAFYKICLGLDYEIPKFND